MVAKGLGGSYSFRRGRFYSNPIRRALGYEFRRGIGDFPVGVEILLRNGKKGWAILWFMVRRTPVSQTARRCPTMTKSCSVDLGGRDLTSLSHDRFAARQIRSR